MSQTNSEETIDRIANLLGNVGRYLVILGMGCACFLFWYLIITTIIMKGN